MQKQQILAPNTTLSKIYAGLYRTLRIYSKNMYSYSRTSQYDYN